MLQSIRGLHPTSFPGSLILTLAPGVKMRDPGNEVGLHQHREITGSNPGKVLKFFRLLYAIAKITFITARTIAPLDFMIRSSIYDLLPCIHSARGSENCAILSILCSFTGNGAFLCVNDVVVDLPCRKDATKVFFFSNLTQINTLSISIQFWHLLCTWFQNTRLSSS